jgi:methyl-accepting chemotaxis protein
MVADNTTDRKEVRFKLIYQILITMLVVALVPLGGLWYISIHKSKQEWTTNISRNLVNNTEHLTRSFDEWTAMNLRLLEQNSSTPAILGMQGGSTESGAEIDHRRLSMDLSRLHCAAGRPEPRA